MSGPRLRSLLLALILVGAQSFAMAHQLDLDAHTAGDVCQVCIALGQLDHGALHAAPTWDAAPATGLVVPPATPSAPDIATLPCRNRGPPALPSV